MFHVCTRCLIYQVTLVRKTDMAALDEKFSVSFYPGCLKPLD